MGSYGAARSTHHLQDFQGCAHPDPDHSFEGGRVEYNNGACDGWLRAGENDVFAIGYYQSQDLAFYGKAAPYWTVCDNYFSAITAETYHRVVGHEIPADQPSVRRISHRLRGRHLAAGVLCGAQVPG